ncbi:MAG: hypothetical protein IT269_11925 [Saprospiraceae bacterium]|nr:hypothetical protein [Saprospiraceae bacterium]
MNKHILLLLFVLSGMLLTLNGCAAWQQNKWLKAHRQNLTRLANSNLPAEQKLDGLINDYVSFMRQDLKFVNPVKGIKYVQKYHDQNEAAMEKILRESQAWQGKLSLVDNLDLGLRTAKKPYINELIDLGPKFKRKYKQYAFVAKMAGKISGGLIGFIGKDLGF